MQKLRKIFLVVAAGLIGLAGIGFFILDKLLADMCGNDVFQELYSPDARLKAVIFQRDCGATTGFSTQISLLPANAELPNESGNLFVMNGHPDEATIRMRWETSGRLVIQHPVGAAENYKIRNYQGVVISYE